MVNQKLIALLFFTIFSLSLTAQDIIQYDLSSRNSVYVPLENGELAIPEDQDWFSIETQFNIDAGFEFNMLGTPTFGFSSFLTPDLITLLEFGMIPDGAQFPLLFANATQFENRATIDGNAPSLVRYETTGASGEQIFKLEYANVGYLIESASLGTLDLFTNMQIWVYEGSNCFEIHYGPNNVAGSEELILDGSDGFITGFSVSTVEQLFSGVGLPYRIFVSGDAQNPTEVEVVNEPGQVTSLPFLNSFPTDGQVYTFCPEGAIPPVSTQNILTNLDWNIYPNPVEQMLTIDFKDLDNGSFELLTMDGKVVQSGQVNLGQTQLDVRALPSGHYMARVITDDGFAVKRFFKSEIK